MKDVQGVMGHTRLATTTDMYMQPIPESVRATVDSLDRELQLTMEEMQAVLDAPILIVGWGNATGLY